ncbi:MAG: hypothetical protein VX777_10470 [Chlamydiota bacterium]|nr:hypothetical protein [Chlamydiota bacterium]
MYGQQDVVFNFEKPSFSSKLYCENSKREKVKIFDVSDGLDKLMNISSEAEEVAYLVDRYAVPELPKNAIGQLDLYKFNAQTLKFFHKFKKQKNKKKTNHKMSPEPIVLKTHRNVFSEVLIHGEELKHKLTSLFGSEFQERTDSLIVSLENLARKDQKYSMECFGKILFLLDVDPNAFKNELINNSDTEIISWVTSQFEHEIQNVINRLNHLKEVQSEAGLQSEVLSYQTALPYEIAQLLVKADGTINYFLCPLITKLILKRDENNTHMKNLKRVLDLFESSSNIRDKVLRIKKPRSSKSLAAELIKAQVKKKYEDKVTDRDAKVTAVTACLSQMRQGPIGSCFATHFAIALLSSHIDQCLDDFYHLLYEGKLTRTIENVTKDFPFLMRMGNSNMEYNIKIDTQGQLLRGAEKGLFLWDCPGVIAACRAIDIKEPEKQIKLVLENMDSSNTGTINLRTLLSELCANKVKANNLSPIFNVRLYAIAHFALESMTRNGLLSVWENSIAEMAEGKKDGMVMPAILFASRTPIVQRIIEKFEITNDQVKIVGSISNIFDRHFLRRSHLHYDPDIINDTIDPVHQSSEGGYVLYDKQGSNIPKCWKRIDNPKLYAEFIADVFSEAQDEVIRSLSDSFNTEFVKKVIGELGEAILSSQYVFDTMISYYPKYKSEQDIVNNWELCRYTPWRTICGNRTERVREVYMEDDSKSVMRHFTPVSAEDVLIKILSMEKELSSREIVSYLKNPLQKTPVFTPTHAFNLTLGAPSLFSYITSGATKKKWIYENITEPCTAIISADIDPAFQEEIIQFVSENLVSKDKKKEFLQRINSIPNNMSYPQFRTYILDLLRNVDGHFIAEKETVEEFDIKFCAFLPDSIKKGLAEKAVHFADTNWFRGVNDIHFCFLVSPCTGKLSIMEIQDDGMEIKPVKEYWLLNQTWKVFNSKSEPFPKNDDHSEFLMECESIHSRVEALCY